MSRVKIIGLYGMQRAGKTSVAKAIEHITKGECKRLSFAQPLRDMLSAIVPEEHLSPTANKEIPLPVLGGKTIRDALKYLGTEWGRELIHKDIWINVLKDKIINFNYSFVVIDDLRLDNEYEWIRSNGGVTVKILRAEVEMAAATHSSELDWPKWMPDVFVLNDNIYECAEEVLNISESLFNNAQRNETIKK